MMIAAIIIILFVTASLMIFSLANMAGRADRKMEQIFNPKVQKGKADSENRKEDCSTDSEKNKNSKNRKNTENSNNKKRE